MRAEGSQRNRLPVQNPEVSSLIDAEAEQEKVKHDVADLLDRVQMCEQPESTGGSQVLYC